jgi:predicted nuclease of restriction endonuclease-like (RecB) superfamily
MSMKTPAAESFGEITKLIEAARQKAFQAVNTVLIDLYWHVGKIISHKVKSAEWGDGVVAQLAIHIAQTQPGLRGFTRPNLFRMKQFYETYCDDKKVSPLVRQLPWTNNLIILSQSKRQEVVEYCTLSLELIAEYQAQLPDKKLLREKLHEFYLQNAPEEEGEL